LTADARECVHGTNHSRREFPPCPPCERAVDSTPVGCTGLRVGVWGVGCGVWGVGCRVGFR
jgi:hypothetical protein